MNRGRNLRGGTSESHLGGDIKKCARGLLNSDKSDFTFLYLSAIDGLHFSAILINERSESDRITATANISER